MVCINKRNYKQKNNNRGTVPRYNGEARKSRARASIAIVNQTCVCDFEDSIASGGSTQCTFGGSVVEIVSAVVARDVNTVMCPFPA